MIDDTPKFYKDRKITWHRCEIDRDVMKSLMERSNAHAFVHVFLHLALFFGTGILTCLAFLKIDGANWYWSIPLLLAALFVHGTHGPFMGLVAVHELGHKTPFRTRFWNEFFLRVFAFISWSDFVWFRPSHVMHHQLTVHSDYDGEVVLPQRLDFRDWQWWLGVVAWNPLAVWELLKVYCRRAAGRIDGDWYQHVLPESDVNLRRRHRNWARIVLFGHLGLAIVFILIGHPFLIVVFTFGTTYCGWLGFLCGTPQHYGMAPDVSDFRLSCRTFTCSRLPAFYYWNMQYHVEHHMYPAVPFYNLPKLRQALIDDLPAAPHGLWATWKGMLEIYEKMKVDPDYVFVPELPGSTLIEVEDDVLANEAVLLTGQ